MDSLFVLRRLVAAREKYFWAQWQKLTLRKYISELFAHHLCIDLELCEVAWIPFDVMKSLKIASITSR